MSKVNVAELGYDCLFEKYKAIAILFAKYCANIRNQDFPVLKTKNGKYNCFYANRAIASFKLAKLLNVKKIIAETYFAFLEIDKYRIFGSVTEIIYGKNGHGAEFDITPNMQKNFSDLSIFDVLSTQCDHGLNNVFISKERVCSFDNDNIRTFIVGVRISEQIGDGVHIFKGKRCTLPFISYNIYNNMSKLRYSILKNELGEYLNFFQLASLYFRIKKVIVALNYSINNGITKKMKDDEWTNNTIEVELFSNTDNTKLKTYYNSLQSKKTIIDQGEL